MSTIVKFRYVEVPAGGSDSIRVGLGFDARGVPAVLVIALGYEDRGRWHEYGGQGITIPAVASPQLARAILRLLNDTPAQVSGNVACTHPGRLLVDVRRARHTAGADATWVADCLACGVVGVPIGPLVGPGSRSVTATRPSSPRSTWSTR